MQAVIARLSFYAHAQRPVCMVPRRYGTWYTRPLDYRHVARGGSRHDDRSLGGTVRGTVYIHDALCMLAS